jgi:uncharacterized protein YyaL (SSP411 family)
MKKLEGKVQWLDSLEQGFEKARSEKKPVLLDFFKDG